MIIMAVIKHISVKGSNGGDALNYVLYKHNEKTGELIVDGRENPVMRDEYYLDGINCEPYSFAAECKEVNDLYGKNQLLGDIKAHHFIISYDPKDGVEHGLTGPKAQQLSMEWAERCLPGFQILVCTHMDGSNESGNIHTHIMMNSVRKHDTQLDDFGERTIDHLAGYKLNLTKNHLQFMKHELMEICEREGLYQIDLLSPAKDRITDKEYRVNQHGQDRLNNMDEHVKHDDLELDKSVFQTQKQDLRDAVEKVAQIATNFDEFCEIIKKDYKITVKESRGRISYLHPDREKYITGRALGTAYEKESLIQIISGEIEGKVSGRDEVRNTDSFSADTMENCRKIFEMHSDIRLVVRLQDCAKARTSAAYANKVTLTNVRAMAETILFVQQNGFNDIVDVEKGLAEIDKNIYQMKKRLGDTHSKQRKANEEIHWLGQYLETKSNYKSFREADNKKGYVEINKHKIEEYYEARRFLKERYNDSQFPTMKELKELKSAQDKKSQELKKQLEMVMAKKKTFSIAYKNIREMLDGNSYVISHSKDIHTNSFARIIEL